LQTDMLHVFQRRITSITVNWFQRKSPIFTLACLPQGSEALIAFLHEKFN